MVAADWQCLWGHRTFSSLSQVLDYGKQKVTALEAGGPGRACLDPGGGPCAPELQADQLS